MSLACGSIQDDMSFIYGKVDVSLHGLKRFRKTIDKKPPWIVPVFKKWAARYRAFLQRRFAAFSKGGGNWPPLKPATIRARKGKGQNVAILRDTGTLFRALNPVFGGNPGAVESIHDWGVEVGYGGGAVHPSTKTTTIADIANFHQTGAGFLPERKIIVPPDRATRQGMAQDMEKAMGKEAKKEIG